jgi:hypothetical protein
MGFFPELNEAGLKEWILLIQRVFYHVFVLNNAFKTVIIKNADDLVESLNGFQRDL